MKVRTRLVLSFTYALLVVLAPLIIQARLGLKPSLGAPQSDNNSLGDDESSAANASSHPDRSLDGAWSLLSILMGFTVFAHGKIVGKQDTDEPDGSS